MTDCVRCERLSFCMHPLAFAQDYERVLSVLGDQAIFEHQIVQVALASKVGPVMVTESSYRDRPKLPEVRFARGVSTHTCRDPEGKIRCWLCPGRGAGFQGGSWRIAVTR